MFFPGKVSSTVEAGDWNARRLKSRIPNQLESSEITKDDDKWIIDSVYGCVIFQET